MANMAKVTIDFDKKGGFTMSAEFDGDDFAKPRIAKQTWKRTKSGMSTKDPDFQEQKSMLDLNGLAEPLDDIAFRCCDLAGNLY
jgi:hypothetical protein